MSEAWSIRGCTVALCTRSPPVPGGPQPLFQASPRAGKAEAGQGAGWQNWVRAWDRGDTRGYWREAGLRDHHGALTQTLRQNLGVGTSETGSSRSVQAEKCRGRSWGLGQLPKVEGSAPPASPCSCLRGAEHRLTQRRSPCSTGLGRGGVHGHGSPARGPGAGVRRVTCRALHKPLINNMCYRYRRNCETPAPGLQRNRALPGPIPSHPIPSTATSRPCRGCCPSPACTGESVPKHPSPSMWHNILGRTRHAGQTGPVRAPLPWFHTWSKPP